MKIGSFNNADRHWSTGQSTTVDRSNCGLNRYTPHIQNSFEYLVSFADIGYLSDPHNGCYQVGYVFTMGNMAISWMSTKQMLVAISSNLVEMIVLHEVVIVYGWGLLLHIFEE